MSYWTDNGAFYYYNTEKDKNYDETMRDVFEYSEGSSIPFHSWNFDSWWYYKCKTEHGSPVKKWTAMDEVFPDGNNGMRDIYRDTGLPVIAHNRWWCNETDYSTRQGGKYTFVHDDEKGAAIPTDPQFWPDLFRNSSSWGLKVYLQDWMNHQTDNMPILSQDLSLERNWLLDMGHAAAIHDINILYCMSYSRHMLASVEIPNVVSIRASKDYNPGSWQTNGTTDHMQWDIAMTSIWTFALGLAPFKDNFWTSKHENGNPYPNGKDIQETRIYLESAMATLSTGSVGISDQIGQTNMTIVNRSIRKDELILKPSRHSVTSNAGYTYSPRIFD